MSTHVVLLWRVQPGQVDDLQAITRSWPGLSRADGGQR